MAGGGMYETGCGRFGAQARRQLLERRTTCGGTPSASSWRWRPAWRILAADRQQEGRRAGQCLDAATMLLDYSNRARLEDR